MHLVDEAGPEAKASFLECGARAESETDACLLRGGAGSWAPWWSEPCTEAAAGSGSLEAACLLVGGSVFPPS